MPYELPPLPYDYNALEPTIDARTMEIHHGKHHQAYVDNLNKAVDGTEWDNRPLEQLLGALEEIAPTDKQTAIRNNGGVKRFGSGWSWLVWDGTALSVYSTPNQDSPLMQDDVPLLGIDVWEHAYYLTYQNRRPDYLSAWWKIGRASCR